MLYTVLYLAIVWAGPRIMKSRKPFRMTWALIPYNLSMAALNFYIASEVSVCMGVKLGLSLSEKR
jgi:elongation of very long chain fatty acids protein 4